jgi:hypothetical protein
MKKVLILLDGIVAQALLKRLVQLDTSHSMYDIVYMNDKVLCDEKPQNFTFYQFDPTSFSKLKMVMSNSQHSEILLVMSNKHDTLAVVDNIRNIDKKAHINVFNQWNLTFEDEHIHDYNAVDVLANGLIEKLPGVPVLAQNVGLKQGEIMEIRIPFGSPYAYRYIGSIAQKEWKIFALYRNNVMITVKSTAILKPNDVILVIGKPKVLLQVFSAISKSYGHFPMPFGKTIYVYLDLYLLSQKEALDCVGRARHLHERLNNNQLVVKITRPTTNVILNSLYEVLKDLDDVTFEFDYYNIGVEAIFKSDTKRYDIGVFVISPSLLKNRFIINQLLLYKKPIFKVGTVSFNDIKELSIVLNNVQNYEQISPIVFDIALQLLSGIYVLNSDPIGDEDRSNLIEHIQNLAKIFNQNIKVDTNGKNPIKLLNKKKNTLQVLPLKEDMFHKRFWSFMNTNSDLLSYDIDEINQILIPIIE